MNSERFLGLGLRFDDCCDVDFSILSGLSETTAQKQTMNFRRPKTPSDFGLATLPLWFHRRIYTFPIRSFAWVQPRFLGVLTSANEISCTLLRVPQNLNSGLRFRKSTFKAE